MKEYDKKLMLIRVSVRDGVIGTYDCEEKAAEAILKYLDLEYGLFIDGNFKIVSLSKRISYSSYKPFHNQIILNCGNVHTLCKKIIQHSKELSVILSFLNKPITIDSIVLNKTYL